MEEDKKEIIEEITEEQNKEPEQESTKSEENQSIQKKQQENEISKGPNKILVIIFITLLIILALLLIIYLPGYLKNKNNPGNLNENSDKNHENNQEVITSADDLKKIEFKINEHTVRQLDYTYVNNIDEYVKKYNPEQNNGVLIKNKETIINNIKFTLTNNELNINYKEKHYYIQNMPSSKKITIHIEKDDLIQLHIITNENKFVLMNISIDADGLGDYHSSDVYHNGKYKYVSTYEYEIEDVIDVYKVECKNEDISYCSIIKTSNGYYTTFPESEYYVSKEDYIYKIEEIKHKNIKYTKTTAEITGIQYVSDKEQYISERKLDIWPKYINNNESEALEGEDILSIDNGILSYQTGDTKYILQEFNNVKKAVGYTSAESGETVYFITNENKLYKTGMASEYIVKFTEIKINNVEDIIVLETCGESCSTSSVVFKTTDNKYYVYYNNNIKELVVDESKIEKIEKEHTTIKNVKEIKKKEKQDINDSECNIYYPISKDRREYTNLILRNQNYTSIVLNNGNLNIYAPNKMMVYNNPNIEKYMSKENIETNEYSIFFVTKQKEIYRMYFEKQELKSFVKYDISNVKYLGNNFEDEDDRTILVRTKGNDYMLDYKEDVIYKIKY